ncbi:MAG: DUF2817 domain-containing protein, partial [Bdellovibrionaceae bacterium]|nr:DUF2817 domain-containing protein [Pseudobdellovibrionaceae bacterium]
MLFIGGIHGDEPEGVRLAEELLLWLKRNHQYIVHDYLIVPCLNPDGYREKKRTNSRGVDLNRNFPSPDWSPKSEQPRYFPGESAGSEQEVQAMTSYPLVLRAGLMLLEHDGLWPVSYT